MRQTRYVSALPDIGWTGIFVLHLSPGVIATGFLLIVAPFLSRAGYPPDLGVDVGVTVIAASVRLGYLATMGRRLSGRYDIRAAVISWWRRVPVWQFVLLYVTIAAYGIGLYALYMPLRDFLAENLFGWYPGYLLPSWDAVHAGFSSGPLLVWACFLLLMDGLANPVVEEFYFRGHLLPRMVQTLGWKAPIVGAALFSLQHFWQPFNAPFLFLFWLVAGPAVVWKRNLGLGMALHVTSNMVGAILVLVAILTR